ncbi:MAG TPA: hypothetical protein VFS84_06260, partial [Candidatus Binatia bacterium]|nr:hypothetical protein [Candidatus Binatia bacterium]
LTPVGQCSFARPLAFGCAVGSTAGVAHALIAASLRESGVLTLIDLPRRLSMVFERMLFDGFVIKVTGGELFTLHLGTNFIPNIFEI